MILQDSWIHQIKWSLKSSLPGFNYVLVAEGLGEAATARLKTVVPQGVSVAALASVTSELETGPEGFYVYSPHDWFTN